ncbi:MAG TPA: hypothetical protein VFZ09_24910 [Archangium sp.]|uniref:NACHT domain-containing protein n=1 Tax=Archangium sp. TaxID=1872627 RepID=UPI002E2F0A54|nr:hypothetical protein [Archangium sp.]HEX5749493.1 hypothetical protein [Archangium sp.]
MGTDVRTLALAVLRGERPPPAFKPGRIALARELPRLIEEFQCSADTEDRAVAARGLEALWKSLEPDELASPFFGTQHLALGCWEAASLLGVQLPSARGTEENPLSTTRLYTEWPFLLRPLVHAPLLNEEPARVFHVCGSSMALLPEDDAIRDTRGLVQRLLDVGSPRWALERRAPGRSKMAALFLRAVLEQWPEKIKNLGAGSGSGPWMERTCFGVTGELDEQGLVLPVDGIQEKVRGFFQRFPEGRLFVPAAQWREAREAADALDARHDPDPWWTRRKRRWRLQPLRSALDLLLRLGISTDSSPETRLFEKLHESSQRVTFWNGMSLDARKTVAPRYVRAGPPDESRTEPMRDEELLEDFHEASLLGHSRLAFIEGGPGSGKSIALQRLAAMLPAFYLPLGPAIGVSARTLVRYDLDIARALAYSRRSLNHQECQELVTLARSRLLSGGVWLLLDGLDEVNPDERTRLRRLVDEWPGPAIIGARPLPNEEPGPHHLRLLPLEPEQRESLFQLLGRPGHWQVLTEGRQEVRGIPDRRKEMLADLCATPLGLSLLAMLPEEELGPSLNVQRVLQNGLYSLLERAQKAGRFSEKVLRYVSRQGLPVLGAAAWAMIQRGGSALEPADLECMRGDLELVDAVHEVLDNCDLVQRVAPLTYQFSHKSFAELCAALHLKSQRESERELLVSLGDPGVEAVAFHFGALVEPRRLGPLLHALANNECRPMSSLALATRLLLANGLERAGIDAAMEILVRRLRLASRLAMGPGDISRLPGGLHENTELWRALELWAEALRPHAARLIAACPPAVARFLEGQHPPLSAPPPPGPSVQEENPHAACDFAERLALALGMERGLSPRVLVRFRQGRELLEARTPGPWIEQLEELFDMPEDVGRTAPAVTAATVWAHRATPERRLKRLDVLSVFPLDAVQPVVDTVSERGTQHQRREALIRAALKDLEHDADTGQREGVDGRMLRRYTRMSRVKLLRRWKLLWDLGLLGQRGFSRAQGLSRLYATFLDDEYGPARWRALTALSFFDQASYAEYEARLRDGFPAVRVEALERLKLLLAFAHGLDAAHLTAPLRSQDDRERWMAYSILASHRQVPLEELLAALPERAPLPTPRRRVRHGLGPVWVDAMREHEARGQAELFFHVFKAAQDNEGAWPALFPHAGTSDGPLRGVLHSNGIDATKFIQAMLKDGSPSQRRVAAQALRRSPRLLVPYADDPDPEIATWARNAAGWLRYDEEQRARKTAQDEVARQAELERQARKARPVLDSERLIGFTSFEQLWNALPDHELPFHRIKGGRPPRRFSESERESDLNRLTHYWYHPVTQRLFQLYEPRHQSLLLAGLRTDLRDFAAPLLREHLPVPGLVPLALDWCEGAASDFATYILAETPQGEEVARQLRAELLSGRLDALFEGTVQRRALRVAPGRIHQAPTSRLMLLDGLRGVLPILEPGTAEWLRSEALHLIHSNREQLETSARMQPEVLQWARDHAFVEETPVRTIALEVLSLAGAPEDAARWRPLLSQEGLPEQSLTAAIRIVSRFPAGSDLDLFRNLLSHSSQVGSEAAQALAKAANGNRVEELVRLLETPPPSLADADAATAPWREAIAEAVLRCGDGGQAKRVAKQLSREASLQRLAERSLHLPEHLLFLAAGQTPPKSTDPNTARDAPKHLREALGRVDEEAARRVLIEAAFWELPGISRFEHPFRFCAADLLDHVEERNVDLLVEALRKRPDDALALRWISGTAQGEETLAAVWSEQGFSWWVPATG